jgi:hypothetical protein
MGKNKTFKKVFTIVGLMVAFLSAQELAKTPGMSSEDERIKFFLIDITEATRNNPGYGEMPKAGPFLKEKGVSMQILFDTRGTVMQRYNAQTLPRLFVMDGNRKLTFLRRGFHEGEEEKFTNELSSEIDRLLAELPEAKNSKK